MDDNRGRPEIHREIVKLIDAGRSFALATILRADGSTPQKAGVKTIIDADGGIRGTLGGGFVEAETRRRARDACRSRRPVAFDFQLDEAYARDAVLSDMDHPEDYQRELALLRGGSRLNELS